MNVIVVSISIFLGWFVGKYYKSQLKGQLSLYEDLTKFSAMLALNVSSGKTPLKEFCEDFCKSASPRFQSITQRIFDENKALRLPIAKPESDAIEKFLVGLSAQNSMAYVAHLTFYQQYFSGKAVDVKSRLDSIGSVSEKVGLLIGLIVGVVVI